MIGCSKLKIEAIKNTKLSCLVFMQEIIVEPDTEIIK